MTATALALATVEPGTIRVRRDMAGALDPLPVDRDTPTPASPRTGTMLRLSDLDPLPVATRLAYAVERTEGLAPGTPEAASAAALRFTFASVCLFWGLDDDVTRLRREGDPSDMLPTLERRRGKARKLAELVLAEWGHLVAAELHPARASLPSTLAAAVPVP